MPTTRKKTAEEWGEEMSRWPESWRRTDESLALGQALVQEFTPFVRHLATGTLAASTIKRHMDNLWILGGSIVKNAEFYEECDASQADEFLENAILGGEGPLICDPDTDDVSEQKKFEQTTRKLAKFRGMDVW